MLYSVVSGDEIHRLLPKIREVDAHAFVNVAKSERILGKVLSEAQRLKGESDDQKGIYGTDRGAPPFAGRRYRFLLRKMGMPVGVCAEQWNLDHPEVITKLQEAYAERAARWCMPLLFPRTGSASPDSAIRTGWKN